LVCPHGVKVMEINTAAKAELRKQQFHENPFDLKWWRNTAFGYNEVLGQVGGVVAPLANLAMRVLRIAICGVMTTPGGIILCSRSNPA
jgi:hypothetical protein